MALDYESPKDRIERERATPVLASTFVFMLYFAAGIAAVFGCGAMVFLAQFPSHGPTFAVAMIWGGIALVALAMFTSNFRNREQVPLGIVARSGWLGLLLGIGTGCLIEGCCFGIQ